MCNEEPAEAVRPGFVRINLPYFAADETIDYILSAIDLVATHGWKLLPQVRQIFCNFTVVPSSLLL